MRQIKLSLIWKSAIVGKRLRNKDLSAKNGDMEKDLSNYFDKLRLKAREIDEGTNKLAETWKIPHLLVGGYAERTAETDACLNEIWKSLQDTKVRPADYDSMLRNAGYTLYFSVYAK